MFFFVCLAWLLLVQTSYGTKDYIHQPPARNNKKLGKLSSDFVSSTECGIREVALNYSVELINRYSGRIYDALQLDQCVTDSNAKHLNQYKNKDRHYHQTNINSALNINNYKAQIIEFYVDINNGNDNNDGSKSNPFQHIKKAQTMIQSMNILNNNNQFVVYIHSGSYFEGTFDFDYNDNNVLYTSYNNEMVLISGGNEIKSLHFTNYNGNIMIANISQNNKQIVFDQLFINNTHRLIRSRSPNGNQETDLQPTGYAYSIGPYGGQQHVCSDCGIYSNIVIPSRNSTIYPYFGTDNDPRGKWEAYHVGGDAVRFSDNKNFWNGTVPAGLTYNMTDNILHLKDTFTSSPLSPFISNVFHEALWGNWIFVIDYINSNKGEIGFSSGGYQEGHGGAMSSGSYNKQHPQPFYVENDLQCLDDEGEWWLHVDTQILYLYPNKSDEIFMKSIKNAKYDNNGNFISFDLDIQFPTSYRTLNIIDNAANIHFNNIIFTHSLRTQLLGYEVPSGGDWSIHRGGNIFLENTENITFTDCSFIRNGGNDIFLSDHNYNINITGNNFLYSGDSSIAIVGRVNLLDGFSNNGYSDKVYIYGNYFEWIGVFGKQTSALFTSVAGETVFENNVLHSGPRAGINLNDGFFGAKIIKNNLIFNWVRETQDHGPINTWDRVEYIFPNSTNIPLMNAQPTVIPQWNQIVHNLIYNGPTGNAGAGNLFPAVDNDDGSRMYWITDNVFVYGGAKNYLGDDKIWKRNLIIFPSHWPGGGDCITAWSGLYHIFENNQCIANAAAPLYYGACNPNDFAASSKEMPFGANNQIYVPNAHFIFNCGNQQWTLQKLQQHGWELNSTVSDIPSSNAIINMVKTKMLS